jgi:plasmid replication initiation protein
MSKEHGFLEQQDYYVVKDNILNEAIVKMKINEYKLLLTALSKIKPSFVLEPIVFDVKTFCNLLDIENTSMYSRLKISCENLQSKTLLMYLNKNNTDTKKSWVVFSWFHSITYDNGMIEIMFHPKLEPYLLNLNQYVKYSLKNIINLDSKYSIRIYELLKQYEKINIRIFKIDELKKIIGADKKSYDKVAHFKRLINANISEINLKTDIFTNYDEIKVGRKVDKLKFFIQGKSKVSDDFETFSKNRLILRLQSLIHLKTAFAIDAKILLEYHRIVLIDLIKDFEKGTFNDVFIHYPKAFFEWHLKEKEKMYDLSNIKDY